MAKKDNSANFAIGILLGVLAGTVAGVLTAPKEGKKTLSEIKVALDDLKEKVSPEMKNAKEKAVNLIENTKCKLENAYKKITDDYKAKKMAEAKNKEHDIYFL